MTSPAKLLIVVVGETHVHGEIPLFEYLVRRLRQLEVAGATAIPAELGFGHRESGQLGIPLGISTDRPVVVFAIDSAERIERAVPEIRRLVVGGLVAVLDAERVAPTGLRASTTE